MSVHGSAEQPLRHHQNINERMSGMPERAETKTDGQADRQTLLTTPVVRPGLILSSASASLPASQGPQRSGSPPLHELNKRHRQWVGRGFSSVPCKVAAREWICCVLRRRIPNLMPLLIGVAEPVPPRFGEMGKENK